MRRRTWRSRVGLAALCVGVVLLGSSCGSLQRELDALVAAGRVVGPDLDGVRDGVYRGAYRAGPVRAVVEVAVKGGAILSCRLVRHFEGQGEAANGIVDAVVSAQSTDVDVVSGATYSSLVILHAVRAALEKGVQKGR